MHGLLDAIARDLRSAIRTLSARPAWTASAILCLGIATGANTAAFTLVNGLLLRPLPFDDPERLVMVALRDPHQTAPRPFSLREYRALTEQSSTTAMLLGRTFYPLSLAAADGAQMAEAELVSGNYFETLRVSPFLGRFFDRGDDRDVNAPRIVLSHRLWELRFRANPDIVGQRVRVNGRSAVVAGIAPAGFVGATQLVAADLWLPAAMYPDLAGSPAASTLPMFGVMGRLAPGVSAGEAAARLTSTIATVPDAYGGQRPPVVIVAAAAGFGVPIAVKGTVLTLSGFVYVLMALLMAVACANVAALVLARSAGRRREIAVCLSLGASRVHIARQLLTESIVLALAGCAAGTFVAIWLTQALVTRLSTPFQYVSYGIDVHPDARVFAYSALATALTAMLCGIAPLRVAARVDVVEVLKQAAAQGRPRESTRLLNAGVVAQFAVSTALLVTAGMLVRAYVDAYPSHPGFDTTGLVSATLDAGQLGLDRSAGIRLYRTVTERFTALPGVTNVGLTRELPIRPGQPVTVVADADGAPTLPDRRISAAAMVVSSNYFETAGLAIREGRSFADAEAARPLTAVVNEAMARRLWPDASPIGRAFRFDRTDAERIEVIGIVSDAGGRRRTRNAQPAFYQLFPNEYAARMTVLMRVQGDPNRLLAEIQRTTREINQDLSIVDLRTVDDLVDQLAAQRRIPAAAFTVVGSLGLLLSALGLYGVMSYGVRERVRELGIRLALGARPADVRRMVMRQGFTTVALGVIAGAAGTAVVARLLQSSVFGVVKMDPAALATAAAVLTAAAFAALYFPARWASGLEPARTLRSD